MLSKSGFRRIELNPKGFVDWTRECIHPFFSWHHSCSRCYYALACRLPSKQLLESSCRSQSERTSTLKYAKESTISLVHTALFLEYDIAPKIRHVIMNLKWRKSVMYVPRENRKNCLKQFQLIGNTFVINFTKRYWIMLLKKIQEWYALTNY